MRFSSSSCRPATHLQPAGMLLDTMLAARACHLPGGSTCSTQVQHSLQPSHCQ